jgi:hypothetical protein
MKIDFQGFRNDPTSLHDFFELSGSLQATKLKHHPFVVFEETPDGLVVRKIDNVGDLLKCRPATPVIAQWGGKWSSDFFTFLVFELQMYLDDKKAEDNIPHTYVS